MYLFNYSSVTRMWVSFKCNFLKLIVHNRDSKAYSIQQQEPGIVCLCLFVSMGVCGRPRMYCSLLAYCTARFVRSNFGHQMPPRLSTRSAL
jgi:hypothetical protein